MQEVREQAQRIHRETKVSRNHDLFVEYLINDQSRNATKAYQRVYPNCSYNTAMTNGSLLLSQTKIKEQIAKRETEILEKLKRNTEITREKIIDYIIEDKIDAKRDRQHSVSMKGNELLAKMQGYLVDKQVSLNMSLEDLMEMMSKKPEDKATKEDVPDV